MSLSKKILEFVVGDAVTFTQASYSGLVSGIPALIILILINVLGTDDVTPVIASAVKPTLTTLYGFFYVLACFASALIAMTGRSIGWLLIRPIAAIARKFWPATDGWALSSALVWWLIVLPVLLAPAYQKLNANWLLVILVSVVTLVLCGYGGKLGSRASTETKSDFRELAATGGTVSSAFMLVSMLLSTLLSPDPAGNALAGSGPIFQYLATGFFSFVSYLPYVVIVPIAQSLLKIWSSPAAVFVSVSAGGWLLLGSLLFGPAVGRAPLTGFLTIAGLALSGALGGWAIGQRYQHENHAKRLKATPTIQKDEL